MTLSRKIREANEAAVEAAGGNWQSHGSEAVIDRMIDEFGLKGRSTGAGFYEYDDNGKRVGLREAFGVGSGNVPFNELDWQAIALESGVSIRTVTTRRRAARF